MDMTWVTDRIAVGGGIWNEEKMSEVARAGITHIIDMQIEWDDTALARPYGIRVLWNPTDDDFRPKPAELFQRGVDFSCSSAVWTSRWKHWTMRNRGSSSTAPPGCTARR